jgi:Pvc16 N-terminal domain/IPT/TIG domain
MSNALAIASVTAVLKDLLNNGSIDRNLPGIVGGDVDVTAIPPDRVLAGNGNEPDRLNLFLYQVTPNQGWRNAALPARDADGNRLTNPPLALDLHYLLTAYGAAEFHAEILLGYAMQVLHETPVLSRAAIRTALGTISPVTGSVLPPALRSLSASDLAEQIEQIKISPQFLNPEEMSKLWLTFSQTHYRLSIAYQVSVVLIESLRSTKSPLPVRTRNLKVIPFVGLAIEQVLPAMITPGSKLTIEGENLMSDGVRVSFGSTVVSPTTIADRQIEVNIPGGLRAGINTVQILHDLDFGTPTEPHRGFESNILPFVLRPQIVGAITTAPNNAPDLPPGSIDVKFTVNPSIAPTQKVILLLNQRDGAAAYTFVAPQRNSDTNSLTVTIHGVKAGIYLVRLQVDGAESVLDVNTNEKSPDFDRYLGTPNVTIN